MRREPLPIIVRQHLGVTQYKLAKLMGKSPSTYRATAMHAKKMSLSDLARLRKVGGYSWQAFGALIDAQAGSDE